MKGTSKVTNGNGNGKKTPFMTVIGTVMTAAIIGLAANQFSLANWQGHVDEVLKDAEALERDVSTTLGVLATHGDELNLIRVELENLRGELQASRGELLEVVKAVSSDRFRGADWTREKEILDLKLKAIEAQIILLHGDDHVGSGG